MIVEIRGVGFVNKGAELMLHAILEKIKLQYPNTQFVMTPSANVSPYIKRAQLGLYQKVTYEKMGIDWGDLFVSLVPKKRRDMYGLVRAKDVDILLDASGFAHGDQWGVKNTNKLLSQCKKYKANKTKIVLLPQAFGPFKNKDVESSMKELVKYCDLIFAREEVSFNYLKSIVPNEKKIYNMPDFTNLVDAKTVEDFDFINNDFCIIPNYKMVSKSWITTKDDAYLNLIIKAVNYLRSKGKKPFILVHEGKKDMDLALEISNSVGGIYIYQEEDPLKVKGIIKNVEGVIGSRFHSLVSSLSQATPALGTSWSHKYQMLFKDYDFEEGILGLDIDENTLQEKIDLIIEQSHKDKLTEKLKLKSASIKETSKEMWEIVFQIFNKKKS